MNIDVDIPRRAERFIEFADRIGRRMRGASAICFDSPSAGVDVELVIDEVELDFESAGAVRDGRSGEPARGHIQRDIPPVIDQGRERHADLADDLSPHVQRVVGVLPGF